MDLYHGKGLISRVQLWYKCEIPTLYTKNQPRYYVSSQSLKYASLRIGIMYLQSSFPFYPGEDGRKLAMQWWSFGLQRQPQGVERSSQKVRVERGEVGT